MGAIVPVVLIHRGESRLQAGRGRLIRLEMEGGNPKNTHGESRLHAMIDADSDTKRKIYDFSLLKIAVKWRGICDEIGLVEQIDQIVGRGERKMSCGERVLAMVERIRIQQSGLYLCQIFFGTSRCTCYSIQT